MIDILELRTRVERAGRAIEGVKVLLAQEAPAPHKKCEKAILHEKLTQAENRQAELEYALADAGAHGLDLRPHLAGTGGPPPALGLRSPCDRSDPRRRAS